MFQVYNIRFRWKFPMYPCLPLLPASLTRMVHLVYITIDTHKHPEFIVYIRIHSWPCTFCVFGQTCNDIYPSLGHCKLYFLCLKKFCGLPFHLCPSPNPWQLLIFLLHTFASVVFQDVTQLESYNMQPFQIGFFHLVICTYGSSMSFNGLTAPFLFFLFFFC